MRWNRLRQSRASSRLPSEPDLVTEAGGQEAGNWRVWVAFLLLSVLWGMPYLLIKIAMYDVSPFFVAWGRVVVGAILVAPLAWRAGALQGLLRHWAAVLAYAGLEVAIPFVLIPAGERWVASSMSAIIVSCMPLMVALLALRLGPREALTPVRAVGLVVGIGGVLLMVGIDTAGSPLQLLGIGCIVAATVCYAASPIVVASHLRELHPLGPIAVALVASAIGLTPFAALTWPQTVPTAATWAAIGGLGALCTGAALALYFYLVTKAGPGRASVVTYLNPAVAIVLGIVVLGESVSILTFVGLLLILAGSWLSTDGSLRSTGIRALRLLTRQWRT